jgi:hypothetical protein
VVAFENKGICHGDMQFHVDVRKCIGGLGVEHVRNLHMMNLITVCSKEGI